MQAVFLTGTLLTALLFPLLDGGLRTCCFANQRRPENCTRGARAVRHALRQATMVVAWLGCGLFGAAALGVTLVGALLDVVGRAAAAAGAKGIAVVESGGRAVALHWIVAAVAFLQALAWTLEGVVARARNERDGGGPVVDVEEKTPEQHDISEVKTDLPRPPIAPLSDPSMTGGGSGPYHGDFSMQFVHYGRRY